MPSHCVSGSASLLAFVLWFVWETVLRGKLEAHKAVALLSSVAVLTVLRGKLEAREAVAQRRSVAVLTAHATGLSCLVTRCVLCPRIVSAAEPLCFAFARDLRFRVQML